MWGLRRSLLSRPGISGRVFAWLERRLWDIRKAAMRQTAAFENDKVVLVGELFTSCTFAWLNKENKKIKSLLSIGIGETPIGWRFEAPRRSWRGEKSFCAPVETSTSLSGLQCESY